MKEVKGEKEKNKSEGEGRREEKRSKRASEDCKFCPPGDPSCSLQSLPLTALEWREPVERRRQGMDEREGRPKRERLGKNRRKGRSYTERSPGRTEEWEKRQTGNTRRNRDEKT